MTVDTIALLAIAAIGNTYVLTRRQGENFATKTPVVGYLHVQAGVVFPMTAMGGGGLTLGRVLLTPDGFVSDPAYGVVCQNVAEWMALSDTAAYWEREPETKPVTATELVLDKDAFLGGKTHADAVEDEPGDLVPLASVTLTAQRPGRIPDKPVKPVKPPRVFKTNSYWKFQKNPKKHDNAWDCVWMIPGGSPVPAENDPVYVKITGEEYRDLKKAGWPEADPRSDPPAGKPTPVEEENLDDLI